MAKAKWENGILYTTQGFSVGGVSENEDGCEASVAHETLGGGTAFYRKRFPGRCRIEDAKSWAERTARDSGWLVAVALLAGSAMEGMG